MAIEIENYQFLPQFFDANLYIPLVEREGGVVSEALSTSQTIEVPVISDVVAVAAVGVQLAPAAVQLAPAAVPIPIIDSSPQFFGVASTTNGKAPVSNLLFQQPSSGVSALPIKSATEKQDYILSGAATSGFVILLPDKVTAPELDLLGKIMQAMQTTLGSAAVIKAGTVVPFDAILDRFRPQVLLCFGVTVAELAQLPTYQLTKTDNGTPTIVSERLQILASSVDAKKKLWSAIKALNT